MSIGYEFKPEENSLIRSLASKMGVVGLVNVIIGVLYLLSAVIALALIFQDKLPADVMAQVPDTVKDRMPDRNFLWGVMIQQVAAGLIFLMIGVWTRAAAASFRDIVATTGRDISHLMNGLASLLKMYTLIYILIILTLLLTVIGLAIQLYMQYGR